MDVRLMIQSTPNPNALKFVANTPIKTTGNITYKSIAECETNPLAKAIFEINPHIKEVYLFDNYITVTQNGNADWDELEEKIKAIIIDKVKTHNPDFEVALPEKMEAKAAVGDPVALANINSILDQTVRPALQMDGGDLQVVEYDGSTLKIFYQGACGSCPSSSMGTMKAIENILRDQFNPEIVVELAEGIY